MTQQNSSPARAGLLAAAVSLALSRMALAAGAPATDAATELPAVKVEGRRAAPADTAVKARDLRNRQARDLEEVLQRDPGISVGGGGNAVNQKIYVRSVEDTLLQVSVDGATQGGYLYHHQGRVLIDPALLKTVEVDKGTAGASAGPGALAGAVRVTTVDAADLLEQGRNLGAQINGAHFSNDGWRAGASIFGRLGDRGDFLISGMHQDTQDYQDGNGRRVADSAAEQTSALAKLNWYIDERQTLSLIHNRQQDEGRRNLRPHMVFWAGNLPMPQTLERETNTLRYAVAGRDGQPDLELNVYRNDNENTRTNAAGRRYGESAQSDGLDLGLSSTRGAHALKYGFNYRRDESEAHNRINVAGGNTGREHATVYGLYLEDAWRLGERWQLSGGLRYDEYRYTDNFEQRFESQGFSPSAGLSWQPVDALRLSLSHARSLRGAGLKEAYLLDNAPPTGITRNVAGLKAERAHNTEFALNWTWRGLSVDGAVFRQIIDDYILTSGTRYNAGKAEIDGYELGVGHRWGGLRTRLGVAYSEPELNGVTFNDGHFGLGTAVGRTWTASLDYELSAAPVELGWSARLVEDLDYVAVGGGQRLKEGYDVHDVYVAWQPLGRDRLRLSLAVRNLFDQFHYDHATYGYNAGQKQVLGYPEPGRDVRLEASWKF